MSTIAVAQSTVRYRRASTRPGCHNCRHAQDIADRHGVLRCVDGGWNTTPMAICDRYSLPTDRPAVLPPMERSR